MLVILKESIENLGRTGDVVKVSDGYARNFLIPRNLVLLANESNQAALDHHKKVLEKKRESEKTSAEELGQKISAYSCTLKKKVGEGDKIFGSVSTAEIAGELTKAGFKVQKRTITLPEVIRTLGVHTATVKLHPEVEVSMKIWVVKQE